MSPRVVMGTGRDRCGRRTGAAVVLYDGACGLCNGFVPFVLARNRTFSVASMQSDVGRRILVRHNKGREAVGFHVRCRGIPVAGGGAALSVRMRCCSC